MHCVVSKAQLLKALQKVCGSLGGRLAPPILSYVLLETLGDGLRIVATDTEVEMTASGIAAEVYAPGAIAVPGRKLLDLTRMLPEVDTVIIKLEANRCLLIAARSRFSLAILPADQFPSFSMQEATARFEVKQKSLRYLLEGTAFAMAQQEIRQSLSGILIELSADSMRAVATDGHRLSLRETPVQQPSAQTQSILLPRKAVSELLRSLDENDPATCHLQIAPRAVSFHFPNLSFSTRLLEGEFPNYRGLVGVLPAQSFTVDLADFRHALMRAAVLSHEKAKIIKLIISVKEMQIVATNAMEERAEEAIAISHTNEDLRPCEIGFNVSYLLDMVNTFKTQRVCIRFTDPFAAVTFMPEGEKTSLVIVMPVHL